MAEINPENGAVIVEPGEAVTIEGAPEGAGESGENGSISDAVAIAAIEGETAVEIAAIHAETEQARIEADKERDLAWHEARVLELEASLTEQRTRAETAEAALALLSTPPASPEPGAEEPAVTVETETISIPQSTLEEIAEIPTEATPESEEERPEEKAVPVHRRRPI